MNVTEVTQHRANLLIEATKVILGKYLVADLDADEAMTQLIRLWSYQGYLQQ